MATTPVLVKLTPNVTDIGEPAAAAVRARADGLSLINTIKSLMGVDLDRFVPYPVVGERSTHGGLCGPAVKPIALHMVAQLAGDLRHFFEIHQHRFFAEALASEPGSPAWGRTRSNGASPSCSRPCPRPTPT